MGDRKKTTGEREITYHVGWKRGKIVVPEGGAQIHAKPGVKAPVLLLEDSGGRLLRMIWRPVPIMPAFMRVALFIALPVISFTVTLWLVYQLSR
jgi:hypothetical protein